MPSYVRLRDLIRNIRSQNTMADERSVVQKELAVIRTAFKEEDTEFRTRNVAKVLYIHMLGHPTHFAQLECLKLIASPKFGDKRIGYLGAAMLLDERTDVQMLLTNSLKVDMNSSNQYICCLALTALGNICSAEMARDLAFEVEKLLKSSNALIRKKAALCCYRVVKKVPELLENFSQVARPLLNERSHGVLLTGLVLLVEMCKADTGALDSTRKLVPTLCRLLKALVLTGNASDYDVSNIPDPFLQVKLIELLGLLGHNSPEASDAMNDILAMVATNTEQSSMVGNAVLYETARTVMRIKADSGLRVLAVNILGRFLQHTDKNIRYVALHALSTMAQADMQSVQRHSATIVDCLKDLDPSIRRRALELVFALMNTTNIRTLMREVLAYLDVAESEVRAQMCSAIAATTAKYAPNKKWHMDTLIRMLTNGGSHVTEELVSQILTEITQVPELHGYMARRLYVTVREDISQQPMVQIACWCIGEYGDLLLTGEGDEEGLEDTSEVDVIDLLEKILSSSFCGQVTKEYVLMALMKLSARLHTGGRRIKKIIAAYTTNIDIELQQRAVEYTALFDQDDLRPALLEKMPVKEEDDERDYGNEEDDAVQECHDGAGRGRRPSLSGTPTVAQLPAPLQEPTVVPGANHVGDLLDLLGRDDTATPQLPSPAPQAVPDIGDLLGTGPSQPTASAAVIAYQKNGLTVSLVTARPTPNPALVQITVTMTNDSPHHVTGVLFQAAVPKSIKMQLGAASGSELRPLGHGSIVQLIRLANPSHHPLRLRMRITYSTNGTQVQDQAEIGPLA